VLKPTLVKDGALEESYGGIDYGTGENRPVK
jgi:hypothetical protein